MHIPEHQKNRQLVQVSSHADCINKHFEQFGVEMSVYVGCFVIISFSVYIRDTYHCYNM